MNESLNAYLNEILENQNSRPEENVDINRLDPASSSNVKRDTEKGENGFKLPSLLPSHHHDNKRTTSGKVPSYAKSTNNNNNNSATIMFTRLDAESNSKRLELAYNKGILTDYEYQVSVSKYSI